MPCVQGKRSSQKTQEVGLRCYKCGTSQDLSIKKYDRHGEPYFICRPCRREINNHYNRTRKPKVKVNYTNLDNWHRTATMNNDRIIQKYAVP